MNIRLSTMALGAMSALSMIPTAAMAQSRDTWRTASVVSAAVAVAGLAKHDNGLAILGAVGAIYSATRVNGDCHRHYDYCEPRGHVVIVEPRRDWGWDHRVVVSRPVVWDRGYAERRHEEIRRVDYRRGEAHRDGWR